MCGRFALYASFAALKKLYNFDREAMDYQEGKNVSPGGNILALAYQQNTWQARSVYWGAIPTWSRDKKLLINARGETLAQKPTFASNLQQNRLLVPASAFYEWAKPKTPPFEFILNDPLFFLGALAIDDQVHGQAAVIITTAANNLMAPIHPRMPVVIPQGKEQDWFEDYRPFLEPYNPQLMTTTQIG